MTLTPSLRTSLSAFLVAAVASAVLLTLKGPQLIHLRACSLLAAMSLWWALEAVGPSRAGRQITLGYPTPAVLCIGATAVVGLELAGVLIAHIQPIAPLGTVHAP